MIYKVTITPGRPADFMPITFYTEDEAAVRRAVEFWTQASPENPLPTARVKVIYSGTSWVPFDVNSTYRFKGGYEGD